MSEDILGKIDDAVQANLCACGCGRQLAADGPSADFIDYRHQENWNARRNNPNGKPPAEWLTRLNDTIARAAEGEDCDDPNCPCGHSGQLTPTLHTRANVRFAIFHPDGSDCPVPEMCTKCRERRAEVESYTMKPTFLRRMLDKIRRNAK